MRVTILKSAVLVSILLLAEQAAAQSAPSVTPQVPGATVPSWVFYWVLGLSTLIGGALLTVIKVLWDKVDRTSGLSEDERTKLNRLYEWHSKVDDDQVPLWYTPRSWVNLIQGLQQDHAAVKGLLTRIVEQHDGVNADLRQQLRERLKTHDQLHAKMLRLAVRVQQAVEALAGLEAPSIETTLDSDEDD